LKNHISLLRAGESAANALLLHRAFSLAKPGRIAQHEGEAVEVESHFDDIAGRSRLMKDNRRFAACQGIQQARLADIWRSDDGDLNTLANDLAPAAISQGAVQLRYEPFHLWDRFAKGARGDVAFIRKIEARLHISHSPEQRCTPMFIVPAQSAAMLGEGLPPLERCLGIEKVGEALGFGEIDLTVPKSAPREFPRLGEPQPERRKRLKDASHHRSAAVNMEFDHVLPCEIGRPGKP